MPNLARARLRATTTSNLKNIGANQQIKINTRTHVEIKGNFITSISNNRPTKRCRFVVTLLQTALQSSVGSKAGDPRFETFPFTVGGDSCRRRELNDGQLSTSRRRSDYFRQRYRHQLRHLFSPCQSTV